MLLHNSSKVVHSPLLDKDIHIGVLPFLLVQLLASCLGAYELY